MSTLTTSLISSTLDVSASPVATTSSSTLSSANATSSHTFPHHTPPPPYYGPPGKPKQAQPNLIFGFVVAFLLIFIIVMGGGMAARVYSERQRRAAAATDDERDRRAGRGDNAPSPPTYEVWLENANATNSKPPSSHRWESIRPLTASLVPKQAPVAEPHTAATTSAPSSPRELYTGRMVGRGGGGLPLLPSQLSSTQLSSTSKRSKDPTAVDDQLLSAAVLVRMPDPSTYLDPGDGQQIESQPARPARQLVALEIGMCEVPWQGGDIQ